MSFLGKPVLSGTVVTWDGTKFVADTIINGGSLQDAYNNGYQIQITSSQPFTLTGSNSSSGPVFEIIHSSNQSTDEGIKFTTEATAPASDWKPIVAYDKNGLKVFEIETDTNNSIVSVRSPAADGNSGFQFLNQIGTYIALDAVSSPTILRIQKASDGYIDFAADGISEPVMRIFADTINGTISSSVYITSSLLVSGTIKANVISSSLTRLADGSPYLLAGDNITLVTNSIGQIEISSSANALPSEYWFSSGSNKIATTSSVAFLGLDYPTKNKTSDYGSDVFFYVSGAVGLGNSPIAYPNSGQSVFGGNLFVSGNLIANGLNITPIVGNGFTNDTFTMTSLSGNIIYNTPSNSTIDATKLIHLDIIASSKDNSNLPVGFVATYTILIKKQNNTQTIEQAIEISRDIFGSGLSSNWDVNFDPDGTIGVTGSAGTSQNVFWIAEITRTRELNVSGTII